MVLQKYMLPLSVPPGMIKSGLRLVLTVEM